MPYLRQLNCQHCGHPFVDWCLLIHHSWGAPLKPSENLMRSGERIIRT